jgi:GGDEF domain-containing protein
VADHPRTHPSPRARPVADLPADVVLTCAEELAKRWAIALILVRPLDGIGDVPLEDLAREAPSLCTQAVRAVQSDVELARLTGRGAASGREESAPARRLAAICGAQDATAAVEAVEALRGVLWEALLDQLSEPSARQVGDVSDRLAYVCAAVLAVAVDGALAPDAGERFDDEEAASGASEPAARDVAQADARRRQAVIVDECARPSAAAAADAARTPHGSPAQSAARVSERPLSWDESPPIRPLASPARERSLSWDESPPIRPRARGDEIEIRDERGEEGPAAWIESIGGQLERFERDRTAFAVLLVELVEIERLQGEERPEELSQLAARVEQELAGVLGARSGSLTRERPGRCWLLAPQTDRAGARDLAERLARAVASRASHRGAPLEVVIGTAVCPEDGREAAALAAHADVGLYAARSAVRASGGRSATPVDEPA